MLTNTVNLQYTSLKNIIDIDEISLYLFVGWISLETLPLLPPPRTGRAGWGMIPSNGNTLSWGCDWLLAKFIWVTSQIHKDVMAPSEVIRNSIPPKFSQSGETVVYAGCLSVALPQVKLTFSGVL